ncbi:MAG: class I SAM-dependent methyltransferase [Chloroflexota bacterium]|nr:class I SAM-dependent methyltransferase [Dehalococcoidia bacterium]MDW8254161.1 class I SAM-dependent methyltransferase [Chloroflexota bacterium]
MRTPNWVGPAVEMPQNERAVLDFIQEIKRTESSHRGALVLEEYAAREALWAAERGRRPATLEEAGEVIAGSVVWKFDRALWRFTQEYMYNRIRENLVERQAELAAFLDSPTPDAPGTLRLDPSLEMPWYFAADFHVQPGGMWKDALVPFVTVISNDIFSGGRNVNYEFQANAALAIPEGEYERILDLGCGFKSTFALKERWPAAEVHGIDLSAPLLKFAHKLAAKKGLAIHFSQQNAEQTTFPDAFFDVVYSTILFHELPDEAAVNVIREAYRLLKPGGWFVMDDTPTYDRLDPFAAYLSDWNTEHNVEPFWRQASRRDYPRLLREAGFSFVWDPRTGNDAPGALGPRINKARK